MTRGATTASGADFTAHASPSLASLGKQLRDELLLKASPRRSRQEEDPAFARLREFLDTQSGRQRAEVSISEVEKCLSGKHT